MLAEVCPALWLSTWHPDSPSEKWWGHLDTALCTLTGWSVAGVLRPQCSLVWIRAATWLHICTVSHTTAGYIIVSHGYNVNNNDLGLEKLNSLYCHSQLGFRWHTIYLEDRVVQSISVLPGFQLGFSFHFAKFYFIKFIFQFRWIFCSV